MTETTTKKDPFDFLFFYEFDTGEREEDALLVGGDDPSTASPLHLAIGIKEATKIVIRPISDVTRVSSSNYHLKLQFTPGILLQPGQITVEGDDWGLEVEGDTILYLLWKGEEVTLEGTKQLELMLNGVMGTLAPAVRSTQTNVTLSWEFKRGGITIIDVTAMAPGDSNPYNNSATETLEMIQRQGKANIPLYVGFFSSNRVLNTDNQESNLKLRITNTSESPITFNYDADATNRSQLIVALEVGNADTVPWALGTADQVNNVEVSIVGGKWNISANPTEVKVETTVRALEWTISPKSGDVELAAKDTLVVELSKIVTAHPTGTANLYLRYKYVPEYQDGEFICPIEKAPLVFPEKNVGIGTTTPAENLHIQGGNLRLDDVSGGGEIRSRGSLVFRSDVDKSGDDYVAKFCKQDESAPLMVLDKDGKLGIGTTSPKQKLHVAGDYYGHGHMWLHSTHGDGQNGIAYVQARDDSGTSTIDLRLRTQENGTFKEVMHLDSNGYVGIGTTNPSAKLHVSGRIKDQTGFVIPVGTIVPYIGSTAPDGWLLCNGQTFNGDHYPDLKEILNGTTLPRLQGRFIVGAGTTLDDIVYKLGDKGGEAKHTLTIDEMPRHNHGNESFVYLLKSNGNCTYKEGNDSQGEPNLLNKGEILPAGNDEPHENRPPYYALNYIIKA